VIKDELIQNDYDKRHEIECFEQEKVGEFRIARARSRVTRKEGETRRPFLKIEAECFTDLLKFSDQK
jgi:hypothetical protein